MVPRMSSPPPTPDAPPKSSAADVWRLVVLLGIAAAVHWWLVANTSITARDSIGFARYAFALESSGRSWVDILREEAHPPGYPLAIVAANKLVRADGVEILLAAQIASSVAGVLLVVPVYWLGRRLFDRSVGFWAALLLQFLPVFARDTADGLSDGPFLLCALSAVACGVWALDCSRVWPGLLVCGMLSGLAYLVRPEGTLVPLAAVVAVVLQIQRLGYKKATIGVLAVAVGFLAVGGPYMVTIRGFTNKPALTKPGAEPDPVAARGPLFAESIPKDTAGIQRGLGVAYVSGKEWLKTGHYGVAVTAIIGLVLCAGRIWREPKFWLPVFYTSGQLAAVATLGLKQGYVSERHLLPVAAIGVLFAAGGLPTWFKLWTKVPGIGRVFAWKWWPMVTCIAFIVAGAVPILNTRLHEDRIGHKLAGAELATAINALSPEDQSGVVVMDHYQWCQFFSGRATKVIQSDPDPAQERVVFVVLEGKEKEENGAKRWVPEDPGFDSERRKQAVDYFLTPPTGATLEWVFHWPDGPREKAKIVLAKITLPPK